LSLGTPSRLDSVQKRVVAGIFAAIAFCTGFLAVGYYWVPLPVGPYETVGERLGFAVTADVFVLLWLLITVGNVANGRFFSPADSPGAGFAPPSPLLAPRVAILQNTLEQCVLASGAHLALAVVLRADELRLIPLLVVLFGIGRAAFWFGYRHGAPGRAFGFATTFYPTVAAYALAAVLLVSR